MAFKQNGELSSNDLRNEENEKDKKKCDFGAMNSEEEKLSVDEALQLLGTCGLYQVIMYFMIAGFEIWKAWHAFAVTFQGATPAHYCKVSDDCSLNSTLIPPGEQCKQYTNYSANQTEDCEEWCYEETYGDTTVTEYDLVCDEQRRAAIQLSSTAFMFGKLVGSLIAPQISDMFGRKHAMIFSNIVFLIFGLGQAFTQTYIQYIVFRFLIATAQTGAYLASFVLLCESVPPSLRAFAGTCDEIMWSCGIMSLPLISYYVRDWRILQIIISIPIAIVFLYFWILPESPHWLASRNRLKDAEKTLQRAAKFNKVHIPDNCLTGPLVSKQNEEKEGVVEIQTHRKYTLIDVYKTPKLRIYGTILFFIWMIESMVYYGITLGTETLSGDFYINAFLVGAVEVPAFLLALILVRTFGRVAPISFFHLLAGIPMLARFFVQQYAEKDFGWLDTTLTMIGKMGITASWACVYLYTTELYPTVVRNMGVGMSSALGRIGAMIAPLTIHLQEKMPALQPVLFGGLAIAAACIMPFFPDTAGRKLPETLHEWTKWQRGELDLTENQKEKKHTRETELYTFPHSNDISDSPIDYYEHM